MIWSHAFKNRLSLHLSTSLLIICHDSPTSHTPTSQAENSSGHPAKKGGEQEHDQRDDIFPWVVPKIALCLPAPDRMSPFQNNRENSSGQGEQYDRSPMEPHVSAIEDLPTTEHIETTPLTAKRNRQYLLPNHRDCPGRARTARSRSGSQDSSVHSGVFRQSTERPKGTYLFPVNWRNSRGRKTANAHSPAVLTIQNFCLPSDIVSDKQLYSRALIFAGMFSPRQHCKSQRRLQNADTPPQPRCSAALSPEQAQSVASTETLPECPHSREVEKHMVSPPHPVSIPLPIQHTPYSRRAKLSAYPGSSTLRPPKTAPDTGSVFVIKGHAVPAQSHRRNIMRFS